MEAAHESAVWVGEREKPTRDIKPSEGRRSGSGGVGRGGK